MHYRLLNDDDERAFALVLDSGDEALSHLEGLARKEGLRGSRLQAVGGFRSAVLGFWDPESRTYERIPTDEQAEVLSFLGDITEDPDGGVKVHVHVVLGRRDGSTVGGHLLEATVHPTCEILITESPAHLRRTHDPATGLALIGGEENDEWNR